MLPRKDVVVETHPDAPVIGKGRSLLAGPLRIDRVTRFKDRQISKPVALACPFSDRHQQQFSWVVGIALHSLAGPLVVSIKLRGIPPSGDVIRGSLGRPREIGLAAVGERPGLRAFSDIGRIDFVVRTAAQLLGLFTRHRLFDILDQLRGAADDHPLRSVAPLVQMCEPVVGHELYPEGRQHIEEWRLLVFTLGLLCPTRQAVTLAAFVRLRLRSREQLPANGLRVWFQQP